MLQLFDHSFIQDLEKQLLAGKKPTVVGKSFAKHNIYFIPSSFWQQLLRAPVLGLLS